MCDLQLQSGASLQGQVKELTESMALAKAEAVRGPSLVPPSLEIQTAS